MKVELNLWIQSNATYRAKLNINAGALQKTVGKLKDFETFCIEGLERGYVNDAWINSFLATEPDPTSIYAWCNIFQPEDYIVYNLRHAYATAILNKDKFHLPVNKLFRQQYKGAPDISFRNM